ncbi:MAG: hypothetical protein WBV81_03705 [Ignavibacteriaceae bacterium]
METFTEAKELVFNPNFNKQRKILLSKINYNEIDFPIIGLIKNLSKLDYCFSLQSCYGHFLYQGENNQYNTNPLPKINNNINIDYRIAYLAICVKENQDGKSFLTNLTKLTLIDPGYIQFGCAEWFWERQLNSFILQVEPQRFKEKDRITIDYKEARYIEKTRIQFFAKLDKFVENLIN